MGQEQCPLRPRISRSRCLTQEECLHQDQHDPDQRAAGDDAGAGRFLVVAEDRLDHALLPVLVPLPAGPKEEGAQGEGQ